MGLEAETLSASLSASQLALLASQFLAAILMPPMSAEMAWQARHDPQRAWWRQAQGFVLLIAPTGLLLLRMMSRAAGLVVLAPGMASETWLNQVWRSRTESWRASYYRETELLQKQSRRLGQRGPKESSSDYPDVFRGDAFLTTGLGGLVLGPRALAEQPCSARYFCQHELASIPVPRRNALKRIGAPLRPSATIAADPPCNFKNESETTPCYWCWQAFGMVSMGGSAASLVRLQYCLRGKLQI